MKNDYEDWNNEDYVPNGKSASDDKYPPVHLAVLLLIFAAFECLLLGKLLFGHGDAKKLTAAIIAGGLGMVRAFQLLNRKFEENPWGEGVLSIFNYGIFARLRGLKRSFVRLCVALGCLLLALTLFLIHVGRTHGLVRTEATVCNMNYHFMYQVKFEANGGTQFARFPSVVFSPHYQESIPVAYDLDNPQTAYAAGKAALYGGPMEAGLLGVLFLLLSGYPQWLIRVLAAGGKKNSASGQEKDPREW